MLPRCVVWSWCLCLLVFKPILRHIGYIGHIGHIGYIGYIDYIDYIDYIS